MYCHWKPTEGWSDAACIEVRTSHDLLRMLSPPPGQVRTVCTHAVSVCAVILGLSQVRLLV